MMVLHKGVAHPWTCDVLGHMTTRFYVAMFDDASYHFLHQAFGWNGNMDADGKFAWVDVRHVIDYQAEVSAGELLEIRADLIKLGTKSITTVYEMINLSSGEVAARQQSTSVYFDLEHRTGVVIPDELRRQASRLLISETDGS